MDNSKRVETLEAELALTRSALDDAQAKLAAIHDHHYQLTGLVDLDGTLLMANETALSMIGASPDTVIGEPFWTTPWWAHSGWLQAQVREAVEAGAQGRESHIEATHRTDTGEVRDVDFRLCPIMDDSGHVRWLKAEGFDVTELKRTQRELEQALREWRSATDSTVWAISSAIESRDPYTAGHQRSVAGIAKAVAERMRLEAARVECVYYAGQVHDIGKIAVPSQILTFPGALPDEAMALIRLHSTTGYEILRHGRYPWPLADVTLQHHERLDGSGYPHGLVGDEICLEARILAVADVVEAMSTARPYRAALGLEAALDEISDGRGLRYDADAADALHAVVADGLVDL